MVSSGLSSKRIILSPFTKEFRGEGHSYESLNFSGATNVADYPIMILGSNVDIKILLKVVVIFAEKFRVKNFLEHVTKFKF